ncbi:MAG: hypothetical protein HQL40_02255 [Alphaproteobacteria bacterium]|nr:hypothetical protein [Alphaproteobacteria bacterium]
MRDRRIGLDFDNTLVGYDPLLRRVAGEWGMAADGLGKKAIRDAFRASPEGDLAWQRLQGVVYGPRMAEAEMIEGVAPFLEACRALGVRLFVVSHKTERAGIDETGTNLRDAARAWMRGNGLFDRFGLAEADVFFESTREAKVARIASLAVEAFVDDLEEVFAEPGFPEGVDRLLFHPGGEPPAGPWRGFRDWEAIRRDLLGA